MDWITNNGRASVLLRHPELAPALRGVANPFAPWKDLQQSGAYQPYESRERAEAPPA
jgi:hypothetical protein